MELVTEPDIETGVEARRFAEDLQLILRYLGVSQANMEKGEMRCEVNISLSKNPPAGGGVLGTKAEIKNLNSFRAVEKSIEYEIKRQTELLDKGEKIIQETRGWDDIKGKTVSQREKEEAHDYRYFPEPDLPSLHFTKEDILKIKEQIVELPEERKQRFIKEYGLSRDNVGIFSIRKELGDFFEKTAYELKAWVESEKGKKIDEGEFQKLAKIAANYLITDLLGIIKDLSGKEAEVLFAGKEMNLKVSPENFAELIKAIYLNQISSKAAKTVLLEMVKTAKDPSQIIDEMGLTQVTDEGEIDAIIKEAINDPKNKKAIDDFKSGKEGALQFVVGQIMAKTQGKANPQSLKELLKKALTK
jgi:aspartyl-tRNA(Asn)/glutamyl-tRNA(Gln) amidotransferase subunit B